MNLPYFRARENRANGPRRRVNGEFRRACAKIVERRCRADELLLLGSVRGHRMSRDGQAARNAQGRTRKRPTAKARHKPPQRCGRSMAVWSAMMSFRYFVLTAAIYSDVEVKQQRLSFSSSTRDSLLPMARIARSTLIAEDQSSIVPGSARFAGRSLRTVWRRCRHSLALRRRNAFTITDTELRLIATPAMIGLSSTPKNG